MTFQRGGVFPNDVLNSYSVLQQSRPDAKVPAAPAQSHIPWLVASTAWRPFLGTTFEAHIQDILVKALPLQSI